jgi:enoyl-CoA hydratase/carnithine racemase
MCRAWQEIEAITIAAIDGYCVGGAFALALACDFRILGEAVMLRLPEVPLGMNMSWQTLPRLTALCGPARAKRIVLFGDPISPEEAMIWGLCDAIAPQGQAVTSAREWALKIAALPPLPVRMTKEAINRNAYALADATSFADRDQFLLTALSADFAEGKKAFLAKRQPQFRGD